MKMMTDEVKQDVGYVNSLVEAIIFASPEPVDAVGICEHIPKLSVESVAKIVEQLNSEYAANNRSFKIIEGAGGYRFTTLPEFGPVVKKLVMGGARVRLSRAGLETVSLIAYRQPISRAEMEVIRGVDVSGVLKMLLDRRLVRVQGRSSKSGRALLYETTDEFLRHFGLNSLDELPAPDETLLNGSGEVSPLPSENLNLTIKLDA